MNRLKILILILTVFAAFTLTVRAYELCGYSWPTDSVTYKYNPANQEGCSNPVANVNDAGDTWTAVPTACFTFVYGGTTSRPAGNYDGTCTVGWGPLSGGAIAVTYIWQSGGTINENDLVFNTNLSWGCNCEAGVFDVQNICTHEFGHFLCLADLYGPGDTEKTMYGYAAPGECKKRTLHPDDEAGITAIYPCENTPSPTPTGTSPTGTRTPTPTSTSPTGTRTPTPTGTSPTGTRTPTPTGTSPTGTRTPTPTGTSPTGTRTPTPTGTSPTGTRTPTPTGTSPTGTRTPTPTGTSPTGTRTPTPTGTSPTGTRTPPPPTRTPTPTSPPQTSTPTPPPPTRTPTPTSPYTSTPEPCSLRVTADLNKTYYHQGDNFLFRVITENKNCGVVSADEYIILDLGPGYEPRYYFYPSWSPEIDYVTIYIPEGIKVTTILNFTVPYVPPSGPFTFWVILAEPGTYNLIDYDKADFYFQ